MDRTRIVVEKNDKMFKTLNGLKYIKTIMKKYRKFRTVNYTFSLTTNPNNYLLEVERNNSIGKSTIVFSNLDELKPHTFAGTIDHQVINIIEELEDIS